MIPAIDIDDDVTTEVIAEIPVPTEEIAELLKKIVQCCDEQPVANVMMGAILVIKLIARTSDAKGQVDLAEIFRRIADEIMADIDAAARLLSRCGHEAVMLAEALARAHFAKLRDEMLKQQEVSA